MWVPWVDGYRVIYPHGWKGTQIRMRELVDLEDNMEYAPKVRLEKHLLLLQYPIVQIAR